MLRWVCLGVGINNFASDRVPMRAVIEQLGDLGSVVSYGATGNLVVASKLPRKDVAQQLVERTSRHWAVIPLAQIARTVGEIAKMALPSELGVRWTRGVALSVEPPLRTTLHDVYRAKLWWTAEGNSVGVMKRDILDVHGRLDPRSG